MNKWGGNQQSWNVNTWVTPIFVLVVQTVFAFRPSELDGDPKLYWGETRDVV